MDITAHSLAEGWYFLLANLVANGQRIAPRQLPCREIIGVNLRIESALLNSFYSPIRNLNYKFGVAEWLWIWYGRDDVRSIAQYNKQIAQFSDNGLTFDGAYGPKVVDQWLRVGNLLKQDPDTRQAVIQIYQPPAQPTKDVPCTLSFQMFVRNGDLHGVVVMRSSDVWLGLPYDFFNFSMLLNTMAAQQGYGVGSLTYQLGSSHLYETNLEAASKILEDEGPPEILESPVFTEAPPPWLQLILEDPRWIAVVNDEHFVVPGQLDPWATYAEILRSPTRQEARRLMMTLEAPYVETEP